LIYLKRLIAHKWRTLLFILIFTALFTVLPFALSQTKEAQVGMASNIEKYGRGSYDLLVRPYSTASERSMAMVDNGYSNHQVVNLNPLDLEELTLIPGLTRKDWEYIASDPRIEVAAPIATLGFVESSPQWLVLPPPEQAGDFRYKIEYFTTDGIDTYLLDAQYQYFLSNDRSFKKITVPTTEHLVVAIDPENEQKLTGINFYPLTEQPPPPPQFESSDYETVHLMQGEPTSPLSVKISIAEIEVGHNEDNLEALDTSNQIYIEENLTGYPSPFRESEILLSLKGIEEIIVLSEVGSLASPYLLTAPLKYLANKEGVLTDQIPFGYSGELFLLENRSDLPVYRSLLTLENYEEGEPLSLIISKISSFEYPLTDENRLTSTPLGIYGQQTALTSESRIMTPSAKAGSFLPHAASGIINLDIAEKIKGEPFIDAIRVKVAGTEVYNDATRKKINAVARDLRNHQYIVDIVAGSALNNQTVNIGELQLTIPWTSVGIVENLSRDFNVTTLTTTLIFTLFSFIWLGCRLNTEKALMSEECDILAHMGWSDKEIKSHSLKGQQVLLIILGAISLGILHLLNVPSSIYVLNFLLLVTSLCLPYLRYSSLKLPFHFEFFKNQRVVAFYRNYYFPMVLLIWMATLSSSLLASSLYRSVIYFNLTEIGQALLAPANQTMFLLLILGYTMTAIAIFESVSVILRERKDEFIFYRLVGWKQREIYFHLVKETLKWLPRLFVSSLMISIILAVLFSLILGATFVFLILVGTVFGGIYSFCKIKLPFGWTFLSIAFLCSLLFGRFYVRIIFLPTLTINLLTFGAMFALILTTMFFSLKKFYRSV